MHWTVEAARYQELGADVTDHDTIRLLQHVNSLKIELAVLRRRRQLAPWPSAAIAAKFALGCGDNTRYDDQQIPQRK